VGHPGKQAGSGIDKAGGKHPPDPHREHDRLNATRDVWTAYHDNLSAARRVDCAEGFVASTKETFEAARTAYQSGLCTVSEYSDAAWQLALAQSTRAGALADYSTSLAAMAFAAGMPAANGNFPKPGFHR